MLVRVSISAGLLVCLLTSIIAAYSIGEKGFYCGADNMYISETKVCNFVADCSDGSDESRCGTCDFSVSPESCGLELMDDRGYGWSLRAVPILIHLGQLSNPQHYLMTETLSSMNQYRTKVSLHPEVQFKPKIKFPFLRATDNHLCRLSLRVKVSEHSPIVDARPVLHPTHPKIHLISIVYRYDVFEKRQVRDYNVLDIIVKERGTWETIEVYLPESYKGYPWSLELVSMMHYDSYAVYIADSKFLDCRPTSDSYRPPPQTHDVGGAGASCAAGMFKCKVSEICIDKSLVCDFGYDCGDEDDTSDEDNCSEYPGRCDFEDSSWCNWYPMPSASHWTQVSAQRDDKAFYGNLPRPPVDHTFRSSELGGRYILLESERMTISELFRLVGPHVELRDGAHECNMRFWAFTPKELSRKGLKNAFLNVDAQKISPNQLLDWPTESKEQQYHPLLPEEASHADNKGWRRFEVTLLSKMISNYNMIYSLQLAFGNLHEELNDFKKNGGFLALDDFSFSPGCHLTIRGDATDKYCDASQFYCYLPTPVTSASCIPIKYYCDFKNDCNLLSVNRVATDELDCPSECYFRANGSSNQLDHCKYTILDEKQLSLEDQLTHEQGHTLIEPFKWRINPSEGFLELDFDTSGLKLTDLEANLNGFDGQDLYTLSSMDMRLPTFSEAHANCSFELAYRWSTSESQLSASVILETQLEQILLKQLSVTGADWQLVSFGVGHQDSEFKLLIRLGFHEGVAIEDVDGHLMIKYYRFVGCPFFAGLIDPAGQVTFEPPEEDDDADYIGRRDYLDYPLPTKDDETRLDRRCAPGLWQCDGPIVCIDETLKCDLQRDCQNGRDEQPQECDQFHQFTFDEQLAGDIWSLGWQTDGDWTLASSDRLAHLRRDYDTGPPSDHTRSRLDGRYMAVGSALKSPNGAESLLATPEFELDPGSRCRLVYYVYLWARGIASLTVYLAPASEPRSRWQQVGQVSKRVDAWQRIEHSLSPAADAKQRQKFVLVFVGSRGDGSASGGLIALDDLSFEPTCHMTGARNSSFSLLELASLDATDGEGRWIWVLVLCTLTLMVGAFTFVRLDLPRRGFEWARQLASERRAPVVSQKRSSASEPFAYVLEELNQV